MTWILIRKLLRDVRPALLIVSFLLFAFAGLWVKITQRVTTEITPFFNLVAKRAGSNREAFEKVLFRGPGKVSQAVLGGADLQFQEPNDFLAVGLLHPVVLILSSVWGIGRAAGAIAGELDRGTMELLLSQPVPRNRLVLAHLLVDGVCIPILCLSFFAGTQFGLWAVGPFVVDYTAAQELNIPLLIPDQPEVLPVSGMPQLAALANPAALIFALSGITMALSAAGRSRTKVMGFALLIAVLMFIINVLGQLWDTVGFLRPFSVFYYYQPQKIMIRGDWSVNLSEVWPGVDVVIPVVGMLIAIGVIGYGIALRVFVRRDLPAPL